MAIRGKIISVERDRSIGEAMVSEADDLAKILVIEDNRDSRDILSKLLRMSGYDVVSASDGETGFETAATQLPDLIITDINMPRMDGIQFVKRVRADQLLAATPVLVVTAFGPTAAREAVEAGANASAQKPFDFDKFLVIVRELITSSRNPATI